MFRFRTMRSSVSSRSSGGCAVLCHLILLLSILTTTNGYINFPSVSRRTFGVGVPAAFSRQPSTSKVVMVHQNHHPIIHRTQHSNIVLFSASMVTDVRNSTDSVESTSSSFMSSENNVVESSSSENAVPKALGTSGDWSAYLDETKGLIFYFNALTGESKWEPPEDADFSGVQMKIGAAKKVEMRERLKDYLEERLNDSANDFMDGMQQQQQEGKNEMDPNILKSTKTTTTIKKKDIPMTKKDTSDRDIVSEWRNWQALVDNNRGQIYYYNKNTRESSWDEPNGFPAFKLSASKRIAMEEQRKRYLEWNEDTIKEVNAIGRKDAELSVLPSNNSNEQPDATPEAKSNALPIVQQGDWSAYFDINSGLVFYYNESSEETTWDPPFEDFPRIVMDNTIPKVLDSGSSNISMERALGYIGMDEMAEAVAWEEAKKKERARKAAIRAKNEEIKAKTSVSGLEMYEAAKKAELERINEEKQLVEEKKAKEEEEAKLAEQKKQEVAAKLALEEKLEKQRLQTERLEKERLAAEKMAAKEREAYAKRAIQEKLEQERLEKQRLLEKERLDKAKNTSRFGPKQPVLPKEDPTIVEMVGSTNTNTLYDILQCSTSASRAELKRAYLSLAKQTHPDALLQIGAVNNDETERRFVEISQAWKILGDTTSRRRYDRELKAKGISSNVGNMFESLVMGAAKAMDEALAKAEDENEKKP